MADPEIRSARRDELRALHEVRIATWKLAYRGMVPDAYLDDYALTDEMVQLFEDRYDEGDSRTAGAWLGDQPVGVAVAGACRDEDRLGEQELFALYVHPDSWGSGVAEGLWRAVSPFTSLWVLAANLRARAFYERCGFAVDPSVPPKEIVFAEPVLELRYVGAAR